MSTTRPERRSFVDAKELYQAVTASRIQPRATNAMHQATQLSLHNIGQRIALLQESDYTTVYQLPGKKKVLVKNLSGDQQDALNPIHRHEAEIQALRYLHGMLLIHDNLPSNPESTQTSTDFHVKIMQAYNKYAELPNKTADATHALADEFTTILQQYLQAAGTEISLKKAHKQVTMARDLGILLEDHPVIATISETFIHDTSREKISEMYIRKVSIEQSELVQVSEDYYKENVGFDNLSEQSWFQHALKYAGLTGKKEATAANDQNETWLKKFFDKNKEAIIKKGVPAPSSARWLPLPANNQMVKTETFDKHVANDGSNTSELKNGTISNFIRMGITTAYAIGDVNLQRELAVKQLAEIIRSHLDENIAAFKEKYKLVDENGSEKNIFGNKPVFYVNYQTLLTPHYLESSFYSLIKDNNAMFVDMAKEAMEKVAEEMKKDKKYANVDIKFAQTNAAINKRASWLSAKKIPSDRATREAKLADTALLFRSPILKELIFNAGIIEIKLETIAKYIQKGEGNLDHIMRYTEEIVTALEKSATPNSTGVEHELALRLRAAVSLRALLNKQEPYKNLNIYQRNIMMAALEFHATGSQGMTMMGCKSARDRTAVAAAAIKTMQEKPKAMQDWQVLEAGIVKSLQQGHHFRSMSYHSAIAKIDAVHKRFMEKLAPATQSSIKSLKRFSKTLPPLVTTAKLSLFSRLSSKSESKKEQDANEKEKPHPKSPS